jgi:peptidoglycan/xylan/chitin deacetylase (PgdA/CDA1 family)
MTKEQLQIMTEDGMYVGSHAANHYWFDSLGQHEIRTEVEASLAFLNDIGAPTGDWLMCYPYGAYNQTTVEIVQEYDCLAGLTTEPRVADLTVDDPLTLPRLDTNDLPRPGD